MDRERADRLISGAEKSMAPVSYSYGALPSELSSFDSSRFVILPIPYDSTSSYMTGSRRGPKAIIEASRNMELYDLETDDLPARFGIHTHAELSVDASGPERMLENVEAKMEELLDSGKTVCSIGGEHSITCGIVKAYARRFPRLSVLQIDAHADLRDVYQRTKYSHACTMRRVRETVEGTAQVGIRSLSAEEAAFVRNQGISIHLASEWSGDPAQLREVLLELGDGPVYVTCDVDAFDPSIMPATGTPEPGGLRWWDVLRLLRAVSDARSVVGFDVVELIPMPGTVAPDFLAAKLVYKIIGYICRSSLVQPGVRTGGATP